MTYIINIENTGAWAWKGSAVITNTDGSTLNVGPVRISCETEQEAYNYIEKTFLPDLRKNFPRLLGELVFPWEVQEPEVV